MIDIAKALKPTDWKKNSFHVTFAFNGNRLLAIGQNNISKTHPRNLRYNYRDRKGRSRSHIVGIHSELSAVIKLGREDCSDITFYVIRIDNNNKVNYSKPCSGCMDLFKQVGYKYIYYTDKYGNFKLLNKEKK